MIINSETTGTGKLTLIFVHGNSQSLRIWDKIIADPSLAEYTKIAVDLPGHGLSFRSAYPETDYPARRLASYLNNFLAAYNDREYILIGTSLGTSLIAELTPFPTSCKGLFLCGAMVSSRNITVKDMLQPGVTVTAAFSPFPTPAEMDYLIDHLLFEPSEDMRQSYKTIFEQTDPKMRKYLGESLKHPPVIDKIANLVYAAVPVAIVYGTEERLVQPSYLDRTELKKWRNETILISNAGHCVEHDQPAVLAKLLQEFSRDCSIAKTPLLGI